MHIETVWILTQIFTVVLVIILVIINRKKISEFDWRTLTKDFHWRKLK